MNMPEPPESTPPLTPSRETPTAISNPRPRPRAVPDVSLGPIPESPSVVGVPLGPYPIPRPLPAPVAVVPEPDAFVLMGTAFLLCFAVQWLRRQPLAARASGLVRNSGNVVAIKVHHLWSPDSVQISVILGFLDGTAQLSGGS